MIDFNEQLNNYILQIIGDEDIILQQLSRETYLKARNPQMMAGAIQGKILEFISKMIKPSKILEIGTFTGYSAICLSKGLVNDGMLFTIEANDELEYFHNKYINNSEYSKYIKIIYGDALKIIPGLENDFDIIYIDGDKKDYIDYYKNAKEKVRLGGYIIVDNVLWSGSVLNKNSKNAHTADIIEFNNVVKNDKDVEKLILPIRDGLMLLRKIK
jgi:predicted O-methyltransferase YrrM